MTQPGADFAYGSAQGEDPLDASADIVNDALTPEPGDEPGDEEPEFREEP